MCVLGVLLYVYVHGVGCVCNNCCCNVNAQVSSWNERSNEDGCNWPTE